MPVEKKKFSSIDEYIETFPEDVRDILERLRQTIHAAAPGAVEAISYQMPTFKLNGKYLIHVGGWKHHIGLYPIPPGDEAFQEAIAAYKDAKSTVRFPLDEPIPYNLVTKMVTLRLEEIQAAKTR
jgi:uncharacterized protein YdhG (YjbR/CyaY superfamily)